MKRAIWLVGVLAIGLAGCAPSSEPHSSVDPASAIVDPAAVHPVDAAMQADADRMAGQPTPDFSLPATDGRTWTPDDLVADGRPALVYFINSDCPCCVDAGPYVERLHQAYGDVARVVGLIDADAEKSAAWAKANGMTFPLIQDPGLATIESFGARSGVYIAIVAPDGKINRLYPGYSQTLLGEMGGRLAELAGATPKPFDVTGAPERPTSGCAFEFPAPEGPTSVSTEMP